MRYSGERDYGLAVRDVLGDPRAWAADLVASGLAFFFGSSGAEQIAHGLAWSALAAVLVGLTLVLWRVWKQPTRIAKAAIQSEWETKRSGRKEERKLRQDLEAAEARATQPSGSAAETVRQERELDALRRAQQDEDEQCVERARQHLSAVCDGLVDCEHKNPPQAATAQIAKTRAYLEDLLSDGALSRARDWEQESFGAMSAQKPENHRRAKSLKHGIKRLTSEGKFARRHIRAADLAAIPAPPKDIVRHG